MFSKKRKANKLEETFNSFLEVVETTPNKDEQLDQFIILLENEKFTSEDALQFQQRPIDEKLRPFRQFDKKKDGWEATLDRFILLLEGENITSEEVYIYQRRARLLKLIGICLGVFLAALGALAILLPLPKPLEIMTIFYFNPDDGITVSDLIGGAVMVTGLYMIVSLLFKK